MGCSVAALLKPSLDELVRRKKVPKRGLQLVLEAGSSPVMVLVRVV